jgi:hypothetical protein
MWRFVAGMAARDRMAETAKLARQPGAIDAIGPDHQGNHGIVEQNIDPAVQQLLIHGDSFRLEARDALGPRRLN